MSALRLFRFQARQHVRHRLIVARSSSMVQRRDPQILPPDVPIEEETIPDYVSKHFYPMTLGQVLRGQYKVLAKLGFGSTSTVWLAEDTSRWFWQGHRYVAVKVAVSGDQDTLHHERAITRYLRPNPSHHGTIFVRAPLDHFELISLYGTHPCLVYEPMRETLYIFQRRISDCKIPVPLLKLILRYILMGLDYLHECGIVHTDIKQDNIMLTFEDPTVLEDFVWNLPEHPLPSKVKDGGSVYLSHYDFGGFKKPGFLPKLTDFGLAQHAGGPEPLRHPIHPPLFHAPEVILGTGWSYSADIWNLGVLIWNLLENRDLFRDIASSQGTYDSRKHLAEMIALLGPPPRKLSIREEKLAGLEWARAFPNTDGKLCWTARECYGGPFFDSKGVFLYEDLIPSAFNLPDSVPSLEGSDKELFLDFVGHMLQWLPEKRKTAKGLLKHQWLDS